MRKVVLLRFITFIQASKYDDATSSMQRFKFERCGGKPMIPINYITSAVKQVAAPWEFPQVSLPAFVVLRTDGVSGIEPEVTIRTQYCEVECAIGTATLSVVGDEVPVDWFIELMKVAGRQVGIGRGRKYGWGRFDVELLPAGAEPQHSAEDSEKTGGSNAETES